MRRSVLHLCWRATAESRVVVNGAKPGRRTRRSWLRFFILSAAFLMALAACGTTPAAPVTLSPGKYTVLGGNPKPAQPTPSDIAALQAAQAATPQQPALVEFYSDT